MTTAEAAYWANEISNEELDVLAEKGLAYLNEKTPARDNIT